MTRHTQTRAALAQRLAELEARAQRLLADLTEAMSADFEEQAVEAEDDEALLAQEHVIMERIEALRAAIRRVDEGRYGICLTCGGEIAPARLAALPEATNCIACATEAKN